MLEHERQEELIYVLIKYRRRRAVETQACAHIYTFILLTFYRELC